MNGSPQAQFEALRDKIFRDTGLDCSRYKESYLKRRIAARMRALGDESYAAYSAHLDALPEEYPRLKDRITVNVTEFFRDADVYEYLDQTVLPELAQRKAQGPAPALITAWSAGCSSGEEAYSLAALFTKMKAGSKQAPDATVLATDLDEACLERARKGRYPAAAMEKVPSQWRGQFFEAAGDHVRAAEVLKGIVKVERHNLFADPPPSGMDLVLCRNVMIYFSRELQQRLLEAFHKALKPQGYFVLGKTETILGPVRQLYSCVSARTRVFQRR